MELDLEKEYADRAYPILASLVTPRPIALVTTISTDGKVNAAPFSFFNLLGANPPICAFAPGDRDNGTPKAHRRRAGPGVEFRDARLPAGKRLAEGREIAYDEGEKAESHACLDHCHGLRG